MLRASHGLQQAERGRSGREGQTRPDAVRETGLGWVLLAYPKTIESESMHLSIGRGSSPA